jgi:STE24 endopeptidase
MTHLILGTFLAFFAARFAVETALSLLDLSHVARVGHAVPPALRGEIDAETARRSRDYTLARGRFGLTHGAYAAAVTLALSSACPGLTRGWPGWASPETIGSWHSWPRSRRWAASSTSPSPSGARSCSSPASGSTA